MTKPKTLNPVSETVGVIALHSMQMLSDQSLEVNYFVKRDPQSYYAALVDGKTSEIVVTLGPCSRPESLVREIHSALTDRDGTGL